MSMLIIIIIILMSFTGEQQVFGYLCKKLIVKVGSFVKEEKYFFSSRWIIFFLFKPERLFVQNLNEKNMKLGEKKENNSQKL